MTGRHEVNELLRLVLIELERDGERGHLTKPGGCPHRCRCAAAIGAQLDIAILAATDRGGCRDRHGVKTQRVLRCRWLETSTAERARRSVDRPSRQRMRMIDARQFR